MDNNILQQLTNDYDFDFVTFNRKLHEYPIKVDLTNTKFVHVKEDIKHDSVEIIRMRLKLMYSRITKYYSTFDISNIYNFFSNIDSAIDLSELKKHDDILKRELWVFHEFKNRHNENLNAKYFSTKYSEIINTLIVENNFSDKYRKNLLKENTTLVNDVVEYLNEQNKDTSDKSVNTFIISIRTEHIFPVNLFQKLLLKFYHTAITKNYSIKKINNDFLIIIDLMFVIAMITKLEDSKMNKIRVNNAPSKLTLKDHMPDGFWDPSHEYYMDPWARYKEVGIEVIEYNV